MSKYPITPSMEEDFRAWRNEAKTPAEREEVERFIAAQVAELERQEGPGIK